MRLRPGHQAAAAERRGLEQPLLDARHASAGCRRRSADCNEALKLKPDYINALDSRGFVLLRMGKYDEAIADYDAALQIEPNKVASLYGRGMAKRRKGDYAGGNIDIAAAKVDQAEHHRRVLALRAAAAADRADVAARARRRRPASRGHQARSSESGIQSRRSPLIYVNGTEA